MVARLFVTTFLNDHDSQNIENVVGQIQSTTETTLRPVRAKKLHMTWSFIGDVSKNLAENSAEISMEDAVDQLKSALKFAIETHQFSPDKNGSFRWQVQFDQICFWPDESPLPANRAPNVIVLLPKLADCQLFETQALVSQVVSPFMQRENRDTEKSHQQLQQFRPHITLARLSGDRVLTKELQQNFAASCKEKLSSVLPVVLTINKIALVQSHDDEYKILEECFLAFRS